MRKLFFYCMAACLGLLAYSPASAGVNCTIDTSTCVSGALYGSVCPNTYNNATLGASYSSSNSFSIPATYSLNTADFGLSFGVINVTVSAVHVDVTGLPKGLNVVFDRSGGDYNPGSGQTAGCFNVYGTPCDTAGTYNVNVNFNVSVSALGFNITLPFPLAVPAPLTLSSTYPALAVTAPYTHLCGSGNGSTVTVRATAGFDSYAWSTTATDDSIVASASGTYVVTATAASGSCLFVDSVVISALQANVPSDFTICKGTFTKLNTTGGDTYQWSPSADLSNATAQSPVILRSLATTTIFNVTVSNSFCTDTASVTVTVDTACQTACGSCVVTSAGCNGALPELCTTLPDVTRGTAYDNSVTFHIPDSIALSTLFPIPLTIPGLPSGFRIDNATIVVDALPLGLSYSTDQSGNGDFYNPSETPSEQYGCLHICGTTCDSVGSIDIKANAMVELPEQLKVIVRSLQDQGLAALVGIDTIVAIPLNATLNLVDAVPVVITGSVASDSILTGNTDTLTATAGFSSYTWSTGATTQSITVDTAGVYCVTVSNGGASCDQYICKRVVLYNGINDLKEVEASLSIFPNPNHGSFNVNFTMKNSQTVTAQVFDVTGRVVYQSTINGVAGANHSTISLDKAAKGMYMVKLTTTDGTVNKKITVE